MGSDGRIATAIRRVLTDLAGVMFPPVCHLCGLPLPPGERFVCPACVSGLPRTGYHTRPMNPMEQRFAGLFPFVRATGHIFYSRDSQLAQLVHDFKYRKFPGLARRLGEIVGTELLAAGFLSGVDIILPVPLHWRKLALRGYNQCRHIALGIEDATGIPVAENLRAVRGHRTQTALSREERLHNASGVFGVELAQEIDGKGVLILDDVCTTGATITAAATAVSEAAPSAKIHILTVGVTF